MPRRRREGERPDDAGERHGRGARADDARRHLGHAPRRALLPRRDPVRARARVRPREARATLQGARLGGALRVPDHVPARLADETARRDGRPGRAARTASSCWRPRRRSSRLSATSSRAASRPRPTGGARRRRRTRRRAEGSSRSSRGRACSSRTRRPGRTSASTPTRRSMQRIAMAEAWKDAAPLGLLRCRRRGRSSPGGSGSPPGSTTSTTRRSSRRAARA